MKFSFQPSFEMESNADWENLIVHESIEVPASNENNCEEQNGSKEASINLELPSTHLHKMTSPIIFLLSCVALILITTGLIVTSFPYLLVS